VVEHDQALDLILDPRLNMNVDRSSGSTSSQAPITPTTVVPCQNFLAGLLATYVSLAGSIPSPNLTQQLSWFSSSLDSTNRHLDTFRSFIHFFRDNLLVGTWILPPITHTHTRIEPLRKPVTSVEGTNNGFTTDVSICYKSSSGFCGVEQAKFSCQQSDGTFRYTYISYSMSGTTHRT
jgi:hypothetical protein